MNALSSIEADSGLSDLMFRPHVTTARRVPAGFTVMLDHRHYGIGSNPDAAYDMARNDRTAALWKERMQ